MKKFSKRAPFYVWYLPFAGVLSTDWYVSLYGTTEPACGLTSLTACSEPTIIFHQLHEEDTVYINAAGTELNPIDVCSDQYLAKSFSIIGYNGQPKIQCLKARPDATILRLTNAIQKRFYEQTNTSIISRSIYQDFNNDNFSVSNDMTYLPSESTYVDVNVYLENVHILAGYILAFDIYISIKKCQFGQATIVYASPIYGHQFMSGYATKHELYKTGCSGLRVVLDHITWSQPNYTTEGFTDLIKSHYGVLVMCDSIEFSMTNSIIQGRGVYLMPGAGQLKVHMSNVTFESFDRSQKPGVIVIDDSNIKNKTCEYKSAFHEVIINNCSFSGIYYSGDFDAVLVALIWQHLHLAHSVLHINLQSCGNIMINNTSFVNNNQALNVEVMGGNITVTDSMFQNNSYALNGGTIHIGNMSASNTMVMFTRCTFQYNNAGQIKDNIVQEITFETLSESDNITNRTFIVTYHPKDNDGNVHDYFTISEMGHTIIEAYGYGHGGVMYLTGVSTNICQCSFTGNAANVGAVFAVQQASLKLIETSFTSNWASENGGIVYSEGGDVVFQGGILTYNGAGGSGGIIYALHTSVLLYDIRITENNAAADGGVVYATHSNITINNSVLSYNHADNDGAVVYAEASIMSVQDSQMSNNDVKNIGGVVKTKDSTFIMHNSSMFYNRAGSKGGCVHAERTTMAIQNSELCYNQANSQGGVFSGTRVMLTITHSAVCDNSCHRGGVMYLTMSTIAIDYSITSDNKASDDGGVIYAYGSSISVNNSILSMNQAADIGGVIFIISSTIVVNNCSIYENWAMDDGGFMSAIRNTIITILNSNMSNNHAGDLSDSIVSHQSLWHGGVLFVSSGTLIIQNCIMSYNQARHCGSVVYSIGNSILSIHNTSLLHNKAFHDGTIYALETTLTVNDTEMSHNEARYGGVLHLDDGCTITIENSQMSYNYARKKSGVVDIQKHTTLIIKHSDIFHNMADEHGGVMSASDSTIVLDTCIVSYNHAIVEWGGAFRAVSTAITILNSELSFNQAGKAGGIMNIKDSTCIIQGTVMTGNTAGIQAGAVYTYRSVLSVNDSTILENKALEGPGGIFFANKESRILIENCHTKNNYAPTDGSAIIASSDCDVTITNTTFLYLTITDDVIWSSIITSFGKIVFNQVSMHLRLKDGSAGKFSLVHLVGIMDIYDSEFMCPMQHSITMSNKTTTVTEIEVNCMVQCSVDHYATFNRGSLHITQVADHADHILEQTDICQECPYGAECINGDLTAKPNFWGVQHETKVLFYPCVSSHCSVCSNCVLPGYDLCSANRIGTICTECIHGYTEAFFSTNCVPHNECSDHYVWAIVSTAAAAYALFLLYQTDFSASFLKLPFQKHSKSPQVKSSGFLINLFFYFQDAALVQVMTPYVWINTGITNSIQEIITGLFRFQLYLFHLAKDVCVIPDMTAVQKAVIKLLFVLLVWGFVLLAYLIFRQHKYKDMVQRVPSAFMLSLLFAFQRIGITSFSLIHCTQIIDSYVLFLQANIICYTYWQAIIIVYVTVSVIPFGLFLSFGPSLLKEGKMSLSIFFIGCLLPLLGLFYCAYLIKINKGIQHTTPLAHVVVDMLYKPYRPTSVFGISTCFTGVIFFKRTILIVLHTFVSSSLVRLLLMSTTCLVSLLHQVMVLPYHENIDNTSRTVSEAALVVIAVINLLRAMVDTEQHTPNMAVLQVLDVLDYIHQVLQLWLPLVGISALFLNGLFRITTHLLSKSMNLRAMSKKINETGKVDSKHDISTVYKATYSSQDIGDVREEDEATYSRQDMINDHVADKDTSHLAIDSIQDTKDTISEADKGRYCNQDFGE